ncbi:hypothetical protein [Streptomyces chartreusis]|uniref:hypothetical protein n=1 Tax=Streptomyces chartreusis TaxID=1969 RepID=UPI00380B8CDB
MSVGQLGDFDLIGRIGRIGHGGMGQVDLGESQGGEPAAVKVIKPSVVDSETRLRGSPSMKAAMRGSRIVFRTSTS